MAKVTQVDFPPKQSVSYSKETQTPTCTQTHTQAKPGSPCVLCVTSNLQTFKSMLCCCEHDIEPVCVGVFVAEEEEEEEMAEPKPAEESKEEKADQEEKQEEGETDFNLASPAYTTADIRVCVCSHSQRSD